MNALAAARERLAAHRAEIERLTSLTPSLVGDVRREEDAQVERERRVAWERELVLPCGARATRTWPAPTLGVNRWYAGAGVNGKLLVVWEVNTHRGQNFANRIHGDAPQTVELDVMRAYELRRPGT